MYFIFILSGYHDTNKCPVQYSAIFFNKLSKIPSRHFHTITFIEVCMKYYFHLLVAFESF